MRSTAARVVVLVALLAACAGPDTSESLATPAGPKVVVGRIQFSCGGTPFDAELLSAPGNAERGTDEVAPFLRAAVAPGALPDGTAVPPIGWHRISQSNMSTEFLNFAARRPAYLQFRRTAGGSWELEHWGECRPDVVLPDGGRPAAWVLDPARSAPGPGSTGFFALVTEPACASGQRQDLRLLDPTVQPLEDRVYVLFAAQPLGGDGECPGNPPASVTVDLGEPLGDRELVDPSTLFTEDQPG